MIPQACAAEGGAPTGYPTGMVGVIGPGILHWFDELDGSGSPSPNFCDGFGLELVGFTTGTEVGVQSLGGTDLALAFGLGFDSRSPPLFYVFIRPMSTLHGCTLGASDP